MIKSMTGFGRAEKSVGDKTFLIDIKSLNGKQFELQLRLPGFLKSFEFDIRRILSDKLSRGSVDCNISLKETGNAKPVSINIDLAKSYYKSLSDLSKDLNLDTSSILSTLIKLPEVITPTSDTLTDQEKDGFTAILEAAIDNVNQHRMEEGKMLYDDLVMRITNIERLQDEVVLLEPLRQQKVRENLTRIMEDKIGKENYDTNRFEQELIFYIEKMDLNEELVRLKSHCEYFRTTLNDEDDSKGKKLSFILQEVGREINTTGAKAYDAAIQKLVVQMKDELEKAKEQILNVL